MELTPNLCRAARALLNWTAADLAERGAAGVATVRRFETGQSVRNETLAALASALEKGGVEFVEAGSTLKPGKSALGAGVRLR